MAGRHRRRRRARGFTIVEVIVIIVIIGILAAVVSTRLLPRVGQSRQAMAKANAAALANAMQSFLIDHGKPESGATIRVLWERPASVDSAAWEPYVNSEEDLLDPWGNPFVLRIPGQKNIDFDIVSLGADGQPGGEAEAADVIEP